VIAYHNYIKENENFEKNDIKASAPRARKALGELHRLTKIRRSEIQKRKNSL